MSTQNFHLLATAELNTALTEKDIPVIESWLEDLVKVVNMNILIPPKVVWCNTPGNDGLTGVVVIDTSHISIHSWDGTPPYFRFDLYSCKEFDYFDVIDHMKRLDVNRVKYTFIDRNDDSYIKILSEHDVKI